MAKWRVPLVSWSLPGARETFGFGVCSVEAFVVRPAGADPKDGWVNGEMGDGLPWLKTPDSQAASDSGSESSGDALLVFWICFSSEKETLS